MTNKVPDGIKRNRIDFLDNLRTFMILLVVVLHAGIVYESSGIGAYFWIVDDPAVNDFSGLLNIILDIFVMPTIFFISGYLALASLTSKKTWTFVRAKLKRLILPWAIGVLTLIPLYKVIFLFSRGLPQEHWTTYFHFTNGIISQSWLWFLPVLFLFNVLFLSFSRLPIKVPNISLKVAVFTAFLVGLGYGISMDTLGLLGWTKIGLLDFQNERLLIYFLVFLLGALCSRQRVFETQRKPRLYLVASATAWLPINVYIVFLLYPWFHPGDSIISAGIDRLIVWSSFQLSLLCLVYLSVETFRRYQDKRGRLRNALNRNSYYVYVIHVIVMGFLALILLDTAIPSLLKHVLLAASTFVTSNLIVSAVRKVTTALQDEITESVAVQAERP
jgi:surface polysaccharide O-acyltransferase-like enzyme